MTNKTQLPPHKFTARDARALTTPRGGDICSLCGKTRVAHEPPRKVDPGPPVPPLNFEGVTTLRAHDQLLLFVNDPAGNLTQDDVNKFQTHLRKILPGLRFQVIAGAQAVVVKTEYADGLEQRDAQLGYRPLLDDDEIDEDDDDLGYRLREDADE